MQVNWALGAVAHKDVQVTPTEDMGGATPARKNDMSEKRKRGR